MFRAHIVRYIFHLRHLPSLKNSWMNASAANFNWACQISGKHKECSCVFKQANLFTATLRHLTPSLVTSSFLKRRICSENTNVYSWSHFQQFVMPAIGLWLPALRILIILQGCRSCTCVSIEMYREIWANVLSETMTSLFMLKLLELLYLRRRNTLECTKWWTVPLEASTSTPLSKFWAGCKREKKWRDSSSTQC